MEEGWVLDGTIAQDSTQTAAIWGLREGISVALKHAGDACLSPWDTTQSRELLTLSCGTLGACYWSSVTLQCCRPSTYFCAASRTGDWHYAY